MKQLSLHEPIHIEINGGLCRIELIHNKFVLPDGPNIRPNKNVDEIWIKSMTPAGPSTQIFATADAKLLAESILKLCQ